MTAPAAVIRVALLDDHPAVLTGLRRLLEPVRHVQVVAAASDAVSLAKALDGRRADVVIMDYDPVRRQALDLCRRMKARAEPPGVLIYTAYAGPAHVEAARAAQADGLIDKSEPPSVLLEAIHKVADGNTAITAPPVPGGSRSA